MIVETFEVWERTRTKACESGSSCGHELDSRYDLFHSFPEPKTTDDDVEESGTAVSTGRA